MDIILTFDVDAEAPILAMDVRHRENAMAMSHQAFGPNVGVPRILDLLGEYALKATFFVPGETAARYPRVVVRILEAGHEVAHHSHSHRSPLDLGPEGERRDFERALDVLESIGVKPLGHRAAMWEATWQTPTLIHEHGLIYDSSLMAWDTAHVLELDHGEIVEIPPHWSLDDWEQYAFLSRPCIGSTIASPTLVAEMWMHELAAMRHHGALFVLTCHPFLTGRAGRVEALRSVIEKALAFGDMTFTTCAAAAQAIRDQPGAPRRSCKPPPIFTADQAPIPLWTEGDEDTGPIRASA